MGIILARLQELHHAACKEARPDAVQLARRLFEREVASGYGVFDGAVTTYAVLLGQKGIAEYRRLADALWARISVLRPGQRDDQEYGTRQRISSVMWALAGLERNLDAQVAVLKKDLSSAYRFLKIAETCRSGGRQDLALEWAEKGLRAFPVRTDNRLREFLADQYHQLKRHEDAMALAWTTFTERPAIEAYQALKRHAQRAKSWPSWRKRAQRHLRERLEISRQPGAEKAGLPAPDHSTLVAILLWERNVEAAWKEAKSGGCSEQLWMTLAERREKRHPAEALAIYQRHVDDTLREAHKQAYVEAVGLLRRVRRAMISLGMPEAFAEYLGAVRARHARKQNLMRLLARANWRRD